MRHGCVPALMLLASAAACSSGGGSHVPPALLRSRPPIQTGHTDLSLVPTIAAAIRPDVFPAAAAAVVAALRAPEAAGLSGPAQLLAPQQFTSASTLDVLRLGVGLSAADATSVATPPAGWRWQLLQDALSTAPSGAYRQWRAIVIGFAAPENAAAYVAQPIWLPPVLQMAGGSSTPGDLGTSARLLQAGDAIVRLGSPGAAVAGSRSALLWQRGRLVLEVAQATAPPDLDTAALLAMAHALDAQVTLIPDDP